MTEQHKLNGLDVLKTVVAMAAALIILSFIGGCANNMASGPSIGNFTTGTIKRTGKNAGKVVHFTTDSARLTVTGRRILNEQAVWLRRYAQNSIILEGHADERGTREYNIALGARRADTVRRFFISRGIRASRIRTISYGKERPVALCDNISCWSQNRRVVTILNNRAGS